MADVVLTGPVLLPGNAEPVVGCPVKIKLIAGSARDAGNTPAGAVLGEWSDLTDEEGDFSVTVPAIDDDLYPAGAFYEVVVGSSNSRFKPYSRKVQPEVAGTWCFTDPEIAGTDLVPPGFYQVIPDFTTEEIAAAVEQFFTDNPIDVDDEVAAALADHPPLLIEENGSDVEDPEAFRTAIGAADAEAIDAALTPLQSSVDALELAESADPAVRDTDLADDESPISQVFARLDSPLGGDLSGNLPDPAVGVGRVTDAMRSGTWARTSLDPVEAVRVVGAVGQPAFTTNWRPLSDFGGDFPSVGFWLDPATEIVRIQGAAYCNGVPGGAYPFILPTGYRPSKTRTVPVLVNDASPAATFMGKCDVATNGAIVITFPGFTFASGDGVFLDSISFRL